MISEDYCSFELAKLLKKKGFDEFCSAIYIILPNGDYRWSKIDFPHKNSVDTKPTAIMCPTHQMAMKWLREKHIYICSVPAYSHGDGTWSWGCDIWADDNYEYTIREEETYEEAVEAALKYSLENLV